MVLVEGVMKDAGWPDNLKAVGGNVRNLRAGYGMKIPWRDQDALISIGGDAE